MSQSLHTRNGKPSTRPTRQRPRHTKTLSHPSTRRFGKPSRPNVPTARTHETQEAQGIFLRAGAEAEGTRIAPATPASKPNLYKTVEMRPRPNLYKPIGPGGAPPNRRGSFFTIRMSIGFTKSLQMLYVMIV